MNFMTSEKVKLAVNAVQQLPGLSSSIARVQYREQEAEEWRTKCGK